MRTRVRGRPVHAKGPGSVRGLPHFLAGSVCTDQAVAVRNFLMVISSFARNQSSSFVAVLAASFLVEFVGAFSDLVFEFLWFVYSGWRFLRGMCIHGGDSFRQTYAR